MKLFENRKVLLVGAVYDRFVPFPMAHSPLAKAFQGANNVEFEELVLKTNHSLASKRITLSKAVVSFMVDKCI